MAKSADAFRTISEVADWLGIQAHVLRFWESKFSQVKPIKRAGGRRYYRPNDMLLLGGIRQLLHEDGLTIKGVQKILREEGISHVAALSQPLDELTQTLFDDSGREAPMQNVEPEEESAVVLSFDTGSAKAVAPEEPADDLFSNMEEPAAPDAAAAPEPDTTPQAAPEPDTTPQAAPEPESTPEPEPSVSAPEEAAPQATEPVAEPEPEPIAVATQEDQAPPATDPVAERELASGSEPTPVETASEPYVSEGDSTAPEAPEPAPVPEPPADSAPESPQDAPEPEDAPVAALPAFLRRPMAEPPKTPVDSVSPEAAAPTPADTSAPTEAAASEPAPDATTQTPTPQDASEPAPAPTPKPRIIEMPTITPLDEIKVAPAHMTAAMRTRHLTTEQAKQVAPLLDRLALLRASMVADRTPASSQSTDP